MLLYEKKREREREKWGSSERHTMGWKKKN
jgi:hypothetical protein